jgi:hypothetical protein
MLQGKVMTIRPILNDSVDCWAGTEADDGWVEAMRFLDLDDGAGWQLLQVGLHVICEAHASLWLQ